MPEATEASPAEAPSADAGNRGSLGSLVWRALLGCLPSDDSSAYGRLWWRAYRQAETHWQDAPTRSTVHGKRVVLNFGHAYPLYARRFTRWNQPLVELCEQVRSVNGRPLSIVDVGAGVGDTLLLLDANCPGSIASVYAIDGDVGFFQYLTANFGDDSRVRRVLAMLSDRDSTVPELVRHNKGSGAAVGSAEVNAVTLDSIVRDRTSQIDLIKIDVDGFDGKVLAGATRVLNEDAPPVIFEWHPILCRLVGNDPLQHFSVLAESGYTRFAWFTKYGDFSHFAVRPNEEDLNLLVELCIRGKHDYDWHYDVIALHSNCALSETDLAELSFAKRRRSRY